MKKIAIAAVLTAMTTFPLPGSLARAAYPQQFESIKESAATRTGSPAAGLALAITTSSAVVHMGRPIPMTIEMRNMTSNTVHFQWVIFDSINFRVLNNLTGAAIPKNTHLRSFPEAVSARSSGIPLAPGTSEYKVVDLAYLFNLTPGTYNVRIDLPVYVVALRNSVHLESNTITIRVLP